MTVPHPIKVLHLGKYYPPFAGGIETFMGDLLPKLQQHGVAAGALVHDHSGGVLATQEALHDQQGIARLQRVRTYGQWLYAPVSPGFPLALRNIIHQWRPDLVHLHLPNTSAFWALLLPSARALPWVIHWHSDVVTSQYDRALALAYPLYRPWEQQLLARSRRILVTSPTYLASSLPLRPWRDRCQVIPLGLPTAPFQNSSPETGTAWWRPGQTRLLAIGRLTYYKGFKLLLDALRQLPEVDLVLVGDGQERDDLLRLVGQWQLGAQVRMPGRLDREALGSLLEGCDCLCMTSLERTEAFGVVLLEAMRQSRAVVVSEVPGSGMGWVVKADETGLLFPPGDVQALVKALRTLRANPGLRQRLGQAGRQRFLQYFQIDQVAQEIAGVYRELISDHPEKQNLNRP